MAAQPLTVCPACRTAEPFHACTGALSFREEQRDDAVRTLAMLRHTLNERIKRYEDSAARQRNDADAAYFTGKVSGYADVLALLGREEPEHYDPEQPF